MISLTCKRASYVAPMYRVTFGVPKPGINTVIPRVLPGNPSVSRRLASYSREERGKNGTNGRFFTGSVALVGTGTVLYFTNDSFHDSTKHFAMTLKRVGVITVAVTQCFYLYSKQLRWSSFGSEEERKLLMSETHKRALKVTLKLLETNGGIYIKLGQHVSAMTYLLPAEWTETMVPLQQCCPQSDMQEIEKMFLDDLGVSVGDLFSEFTTDPIGVLSLLQVHVATLRETGEKVLVKCQHPSLKEFVPLDVLMTKLVFDLMLKVFPEYPLTWLGDELLTSIFVELDFQNELRNAEHTDEYFSHYKDKTLLRIPHISEAHKRILIMEFVGGARLDDLEYLDSHHISRGEVSSCLSHIFNNMIFTPGVGVHCDPHGGNLAIRSRKPTADNKHNFEIVLYDHGLYRQIPDQMRKDYLKFWLLLLDGDTKAMEQHAKLFAGIKSEQFPILALAITGRDYKHALSGNIMEVRGEDEINNMTESLLNKGHVLDLMSLLLTLPRVVLLILKTNDLTRHLDESLQNPLGLERTFFILATYCARTVLQEDLEKASILRGWNWLIAQFKCYWKYYKRVDQLVLYDIGMSLRNLLRKGRV